MDAITETYIDVRPDLQRLTAGFRRRWPETDRDECEATVNLAFAQAWHSWRPDKPFLRSIRAWWSLQNLSSAEFRQRSRFGELNSHEPAWKQTDGEWIEDISADAWLVIQLVIDPPSRIRAGTDQAKRGIKRIWRRALTSWLLQAGWEAKRIKRTFEEIRKALTLA